jgi:hypothetical protein
MRTSSARSLISYLGLLFGLATVLVARRTPAENFKWTDQGCRLRFAQDLNQVTPRDRERAKDGALKEGEGSVI